MSRWINTENATPDKKDSGVTVDVLLFLSPGMVVSGFYSYDDQEWYDFNGDLVDDVTHWMPLPENPK